MIKAPVPSPSENLEEFIHGTFRAALQDRLWLTAVFFLLCRGTIRRCARRAAERQQEQKMSPFIYQLR